MTGSRTPGSFTSESMPPRSPTSGSLPSGRYLSASGVVRADSGGQTGAMLMRSRLIGEVTGNPVDILSFDPSSQYSAIRESLSARGLLAPGMQLLNLYEHYRDRGWGSDHGTGHGLPPTTELQAADELREDGTPWLTAYRNAAGEVVLNDYRRADGSVYLRADPYKTTRHQTLPRTLLRVGRNGEVLGAFADLPALYRRWIADLTAADERTFVFIDSRFLVPLLAPVDDPTVHLIYTLHNCHLARPRTWNAPVLPDYQRAMNSIEHLDAFVTLTRRQADDIQRRWGPRPNVFVVPNPVESPPEPSPLPLRDPNRVTMVARLERQKRIGQAILVMKRVVRRVPDARLDIYGSGAQKEALQALIDQHHLRAVVRLRGHHGNARDRLWTSSAFLLTSENEGYPLATLESLSRGCPVVSYDIPYGPRDQITDGVDGYLVPDGKVGQAAARVVALLSSPERVAAMGEAGRRTAARHGIDAFVSDWAAVLNTVVQRAPRRTRLREITASITVRRTRRRGPAVASDPLRITGRVLVRADSRHADPRTAALVLVAVDSETGSFTAIPMVSNRSGLTFRVRAMVDPPVVLSGSPGDAFVELRFAWENSYWSITLRTEHLTRGGQSAIFDNGALRVSGIPVTTRPARRRVRRWLQRARSAARAARSALVSTSRT